MIRRAKNKRKNESKRIAVFPGTFDPFTLGHLNIVRRANRIFDNLIIAILINPEKTTLFNEEERVKVIKESIKDLEDIDVISYKGFLVDLMKEREIRIVVRGVRDNEDFNYEKKMYLINKKLYSEFEVVFLPSEYENISSSFVKGFLKHTGWEEKIEKFLPTGAFNMMLKKARAFKEFKKFLGERYEELLNLYGERGRDEFNLAYIFYGLNELKKREEKIALWFYGLNSEGRDKRIRNAAEVVKTIKDNELANAVIAELLRGRIEETVERIRKSILREKP